MKTSIVGTQFSKAYAKDIQEGSEVLIAHDPSNKFDENALTVTFGDELLGHIGKNSDLYKLERDNFPKKAYVTDFYRKTEGDKFNKHDADTIVACNIEVPKETNLIQSFTEDVAIDFDEASHTYTYKGKKFKGGTTFIKKYLVPFDKIVMSERIADGWGMSAEDIQSAWKLNQQFSIDFGHGIHKALEFEDLYRHHTKSKDGSRCFNIKHPGLKNIVQEFFDLYDSLGFKGDVLPEVVLTDIENGFCGTADRLLVTSWERKTCRLQDYKVNHSFNVKGSEQLTNLPEGMKLPNTKLSKLSLQLKFYAAMLEKQGWTVEAFDAFVYSDKWEYFEADMLDGFDIITGDYNI